MASKIVAINTFRPRIECGNTVQKQELVRQLARATGLNEGTTDLSMKELRDIIVTNLRAGRGVKVEGLGTWLPNIDLQGKFDVQYRVDPVAKNELNAPGTFVGTILNRENIGKTVIELVEMWNTSHPEDPVVVEEPETPPA
jgi:nucleoid DNA-binding protein